MSNNRQFVYNPIKGLMHLPPDVDLADMDWINKSCALNTSELDTEISAESVSRNSVSKSIKTQA